MACLSGDSAVRGTCFGPEVRGSTPSSCKVPFCLPRPPRSLAPLAAPLARPFPPSAPLVPSRGSRKGGVEPADAEGSEGRKRASAPPSEPPISAPSRRHFGKNRTGRTAHLSFPSLHRGGRTAPKKCDGQTHIVGLDRGTRSRTGTYHGTGTYCGTGEGACGILKVWNFKVRVQGWGLAFSLGLLGQRGTLIVLIPRARADERGEHVELQNGF